MEIKLEELIAAIQGRIHATHAPSPITGQHIVVLDRSFVYVGTVTIEGEFVKITNAKNIRLWGTTQGLGELRNGPLSGTKLDAVGEVIAPLRAVIHFIPCKGF